MLGDAKNDVRGCRGDGMIEEGVEMWPILQYLNHYNICIFWVFEMLSVL